MKIKCPFQELFLQPKAIFQHIYILVWNVLFCFSFTFFCSVHKAEFHVDVLCSFLGEANIFLIDLANYSHCWNRNNLWTKPSSVALSQQLLTPLLTARNFRMVTWNRVFPFHSKISSFNSFSVGARWQDFNPWERKKRKEKEKDLNYDMKNS